MFAALTRQTGVLQLLLERTGGGGGSGILADKNKAVGQLAEQCLGATQCCIIRPLVNNVFHLSRVVRVISPKDSKTENGVQV